MRARPVPLLATLLALGSVASLSHASPPGAPGVSVPLHALRQPCLDPRFPRLAGPWVVGCGTSGHVDRALSLASGRLVMLPRPLARASTGPSVVFGTGAAGGWFRLEESGATENHDVARVNEGLLAPATTDGVHIALLSERGLQAYDAESSQRRLHAVQPMGWHAPALAWPWVAWVEDAGDGDPDVWIRNATKQTPARALATGPGRQDRVVGRDGWIGWIDEGDVVLLEPVSGRERRLEANTGFHSPATVWNGEACWETRGADLDIVCSDMDGISGPGHQSVPDRWGHWLLYRDGEQPMLYTAPSEAE